MQWRRVEYRQFCSSAVDCVVDEFFDGLDDHNYIDWVYDEHQRGLSCDRPGVPG